jgi:hypothetical protein
MTGDPADLTLVYYGVDAQSVVFICLGDFYIASWLLGVDKDRLCYTTSILLIATS